MLTIPPSSKATRVGPKSLALHRLARLCRGTGRNVQRLYTSDRSRACKSVVTGDWETADTPSPVTMESLEAF